MALLQDNKLSNAQIIGIIVMMAGIYFAREYWNNSPAIEPQGQASQVTQP